jgi:hypothetical protein
MIDEKTKRKECFDEANSVWVTLADGCRYAFPKPWIQVHASFRDGKVSNTYPVLTVGPDLDELVAAMSECHDNAAILCASATLASFLLRQNYELADDALDTLFAFRVADPDSWNWAREVMDVATGAGGSRSFRGGGDSA